ncbi:N-acetyl sugar amidotransferase [Gammaproteobacteria bacterium]|nr:N-acetyl sugar amidotransferase [Gammaproteobacteria bacterium]
MAIKSLKYCNRCVMPETTEGIEFDENGICTACTSSEQKMHINWNERREMLESLLNKAKKDAKKNDSPYDCIVPISGGKDSTYQLHVLVKVYKLRVLAVTFSHNWYSKIGFYNLVNCLEEFNVDHIQFTPNRKSVGVAARKSLKAIGDACWHCHSGVGSFPLHIAVKFKIPLLIWGESIAEASGRASHFNPVLKFDRDYFLKVSAKVSVDDFSSDKEERRMFQLFEPPTMEECIEQDVHGIHIGDFIFWDEEKQLEFIQEEYGWIEDTVEGAYKGYKSVECIMPGVHDYTNYLKRGYGRATSQASNDVRQGLMGRSEALKIAHEVDQLEPAALKYFLSITGYTEEEFYKSMKELRRPQVSNSEIPIKQIQDSPETSLKLPFVIEFINSIRETIKENDTRNN